MFETSPLPSESATKHAARLNPDGSLPTVAAPVLKRRTRESEAKRHEENEPKWAQGRAARARLLASAVSALKTRFGLDTEARSKYYTEQIRLELGRADKSAGRVLVIAEGMFGFVRYYVVPAFGGYELWTVAELDAFKPSTEKRPECTARSTATTDARATLLAYIAEIEQAKRDEPEPTPPMNAAKPKPKPEPSAPTVESPEVTDCINQCALARSYPNQLDKEKHAKERYQSLPAVDKIPPIAVGDEVTEGYEPGTTLTVEAIAGCWSPSGCCHLLALRRKDNGKLVCSYRNLVTKV